MDNLNIVVFALNNTSSPKLQVALPNVGQDHFFTLPMPDSEGIFEVNDIKKASQFSPKIVLIEVGGDYQYQNFIDIFQSQTAANCPQFVAVLDKKPTPQETSALTQLSIDGYIFSDWSPEFTTSKLEKLNKLHDHNSDLSKQVKTTSETALTAMKAASEVGLLMQLVEWLHTAVCHDDVANSLFKICRSMELNAIALICDDQEQNFFPAGMVPKSATRILLETHQSAVRVLSKNRILIFRLDYLVLMITNAPWQDEDTYGRYRDILLQAAALAEAKARTITVNNLITSQHGKVGAIMKLIKNLSSDTQKYSREIMQKFSDDLAMTAVSLDLTDIQEEHLLNMSKEAHDSIEVLYQSNDALETHFHELISSITKVRELTKNNECENIEDTNSDDEITLF